MPIITEQETSIGIERVVWMSLSDECKFNVCSSTLSLCRAISQHVSHERFAELYENIPDLLDGQGVGLKIITAINERPDCGMTDKDFGVYLVGPQVFVTASSKTSLEEMSSIYQTRLMSARQSARMMGMGLCKYIQEDLIEFAKKHANRLPNGREDSIEVSNLGSKCIVDYIVWWVEREGIVVCARSKGDWPSTHFYNGVICEWTQGCFECSASNI